MGGKDTKKTEKPNVSGSEANGQRGESEGVRLNKMTRAASCGRQGHEKKATNK